MIKFAAIKQDDIVFVGKRHHNCIATMIECGLPAPIRGEQGFVDHKGNFLNRQLALADALESGQITIKHENKNELYSEDLY